MTALISSKLDQCFELSEYDWTPKSRETSPSMYLYELANWLTTVVDSLAIKETYKEDAYEGAMGYIAECLIVRIPPHFSDVLNCFFFPLYLQNFLAGRDVPMMNENAISNILIDIDFLEDILKQIGRSHLASVFAELRQVKVYSHLNTTWWHF
jgi:hypothetical protein